MRLFVHKLTHWEYWPAWLIYFPVAFTWLYWIIRWRRPTFFLGVNPGIKNSGFCNVSKMEIHQQLPYSVYPETVFVNCDEYAAMPESEAAALGFPLIAKPDFGVRSMGVKLIYNMDELQAYHRRASFNYLIQEYIDLPCEAGVFFVRMPGEREGVITGITGKTFFAVVGDGVSTIEQLMRQTPRGALQWKWLRREKLSDYGRIPKLNETVRLMPFGNHCRGTLFTDESHRINEQLTATINRICHCIGEFYYGRLDIRFNTWNELAAGLNFRVVEVNGALSEPTHCYDPKHSYGFAVREFIRHHRYMCRISNELYRRGASVDRLDFRMFLRELGSHRKALARIRTVNS
ncbi:hypothetical protein [Parapedobacter pyrenivorans]|uniref:hypothetical protein n=1 Tax=Parapedobacter pyrenivorans TaxID=1305674 RepID=UPI00333E5BB1